MTSGIGVVCVWMCVVRKRQEEGQTDWIRWKRESMKKVYKEVVDGGRLKQRTRLKLHYSCHSKFNLRTSGKIYTFT